jgi:hypothetical protein
MKSKLLFLAMMLLGIISATATTAGNAVLNGEDLNRTRYRFTQPITFVKRGVEFLIFPDGSFDFNTEVFSTDSHNEDYYYRRNRRGTNRTYGAPGSRYHYNDRGVVIRHDRQGRVRRIGNVFINYDRRGKIKRAGSVYMSYRRGQLSQVGGLHILYNRYGEVIGTRGFVNFNNRDCNIYNSNSFTSNGYYEDDWNTDWNNNNFYYYRKNGTIKKQKKIKS